MNKIIKLFDTHSHYDNAEFDEDRDELIAKMLSEDVAGFVAMGCNEERSENAVELSMKYDNVYAAVGIHPEDIDGLSKEWEKEIATLAALPKTVAIGEIGLDYSYEKLTGDDRERQRRFFCRQLDIAEDIGLPVVIHTRDATEDTLKIIREYFGADSVHKMHGAVVHCFSGSAEVARELVSMGIYISFTGVITFKNARRAVSAAMVVPDDMIMLETDCPYMAPAPHRGERCDSSLCWFTAQRLAMIKKRTTDEIVEMCNRNAERFFGIELR